MCKAVIRALVRLILRFDNRRRTSQAAALPSCIARERPACLPIFETKPKRGAREDCRRELRVKRLLRL